MKDQIIQELKRLEAEKGIRILYAVESGSRAWGFASADSDWDVRFIYVHHPDWYLSIDDKRDNMEVMLPNDLDFAGWELRKTLKLFRKSNPPLLEWLDSPLIYLEQYSTAQQMRELMKEYFSPKSCLHHYLNMAKRNFLHYLQTEEVRIKKYFYVLRPILACKWIESEGSMAPMVFQKLLDTQVQNTDLKKEIEKLQERKMSGEELDRESQIPIIQQFLEEQIDHFTALVQTFEKHSAPHTERLDQLFRNTLKEVWEE